jgi:S1-C subfamily serine protease
MTSLRLLTAAAGLCVALALPAPTALGAGDSPIATVATKKAPAMVSVKFMMSISGMGQDQEREAEAAGLLIDDKGLVLVSNLEIGGALQRGQPSAQAKDIKVLIGDDTEGVPAKVIGRDTELELAWIQLEKPADKALAFVDLSKGAAVSVGQELVGLDRMNKYYDRAIVGFTTTVGGLAKKPRNLIIPSGGKIEWIGVPVFTGAGEFVGLSVVQPMNADEEDQGMRNPGRMSSFDRGLKIMPAAEIAAATTRALEAAKSGKGLGMEEPKPAEAEPTVPMITPGAAPAAPAPAEQPK